MSGNAKFWSLSRYLSSSVEVADRTSSLVRPVRFFQLTLASHKSSEKHSPYGVPPNNPIGVPSKILNSMRFSKLRRSP